MTQLDTIILGIGGVGSAALFHCARRGVRVLGIDRFAPPHDRGSSHGDTRLIRQTYFEHPDYVPLVQRAFNLWQDLERRSGQTLYHETGLLQIGPAAGEVISGVRQSARLHKLGIENLSARDAAARFPGFRVPEYCEAIFERRAGYLLVERCVEVHIEQAVRLGAQVRTDEAVRGWRAEGDGVVVETDHGSYAAARLIICAGAWSAQLLGSLGIPLEVRRKPLYWWRTRGETYRADRGSPAFLYDLPDGCFYGFPQIDPRGVKVAEHTGGDTADPDALDRELHPADQARIVQ